MRNVIVWCPIDQRGASEVYLRASREQPLEGFLEEIGVK